MNNGFSLKSIAEGVSEFIDTFDARWATFVDDFIVNAGYELVIEGLINTAIIAVAGLIIGILIGTVIAAIRVMPKYKRLPRILDKICGLYVGAFRGTPIVVQLLVAYFVLLPILGIKIDAVIVAVIVFGMNSGAYVSEIMRSGIQSVDYGQTEGGRAVGLSYATTMMQIVIPQAVKNILPTLGNEFIVLVKETSVASFITVTDIYLAFNLGASNSYEFLIPYFVMALIYIIIISIITAFVKLMERSLKKSDRRH